MSIEKVREYFKLYGKDGDIREFAESSATVELAAHAVGVIPARIAKSMSFLTHEGPMILVLAGDARIDNKKYKSVFGEKAKVLSPEDALAFTGHAVGGVCPFALPENVRVFLDVSLRRFPTVFPACGSSNSAIELTCGELETLSRSLSWVDVANSWDPTL